MTQTEALKLALDYLYDHRMGGHVIAAIKEALAQQSNEQVEPVAWAHKEGLETIKDFDASIYANGGFDDAVPLYTHPPAPTAQPKEPEQEPVALESIYETIIQWDEGGGKRSRRELARRIAALYTTPPQRTWVALTDEQADKILETPEKVNPKYAGWVGDQRRAYVRAGYNAAHGKGDA